MEQLHKKFTDSQIKALMTRYLKKEIGRKYIQEILGIKKTRFFALAKQLKEDPENFSISYSRKVPTRKISKDIEKNIVKELKMEKDLIKSRYPRASPWYSALRVNKKAITFLTIILVLQY